DGVEIAGEVKVDVLHRNDLRMAATGRTALHAEGRAERRLAQADDGPPAYAVEAVAEPHSGGGLALAGRRRADGGDEDELTVRPPLQRADETGAYLRLVMPVWRQMLHRNAKACADLGDRLLRCHPRNLD